MLDDQVAELLTQRWSPRADSRSLHQALVRNLSDVPTHLLRSITWDQGTELAAHEKITADLGVTVYFCDPCSPWQRPSNENTNGLLRDYFLVASLAEPRAVAMTVGSRPIDPGSSFGRR